MLTVKTLDFTLERKEGREALFFQQGSDKSDLHFERITEVIMLRRRFHGVMGRSRESSMEAG